MKLYYNKLDLYFFSRFYFSFIIGPKGAVRHRLENETKTHIRVPKQGFDGSIGTTLCFAVIYFIA